MENELANELTGDALDDYEVGNEGQAIAEYLSLLGSAAASSSFDQTEYLLAKSL